MENLEEEYLRRLKEIDRKLHEPKKSKEIDEFLLKLAEEFNCTFKLVYDVFPETDRYEDNIDNGRVICPRDYPTMTLGEFLKHIDTENHDMKIYIDPIYMREGVNAINNLLTTTTGDDAMIIAPVSHNKNNNENE